MHSDFCCRSCGLRFTVGWSDEPPLADGYGATSRFVCTECGTEVLIEIAIRDRGTSHQRLFDVALIALDESKRGEAAEVFRTRFDMTSRDAAEAVELLPMEVARSVNRQLAEELVGALSPVGTVRVTEVASAPNPLHGPSRLDRLRSGMHPRFGDDEVFEEIEPLGSRQGPNGEFGLDAQVCTACKSCGSLIGNPMEVTEVCPHCGKGSVECVEEWMT